MNNLMEEAKRVRDHYNGTVDIYYREVDDKTGSMILHFTEPKYKNMICFVHYPKDIPQVATLAFKLMVIEKRLVDHLKQLKELE